MADPLTKPASEPKEDEEVQNRAAADVGIVAALKLELDPFLQTCDRVKRYTGGDFTFRGGFLRDIRVATVECGAGGKKAARAAHALIDAHTPRWMLSIGFSGALTDRLQIGDIIVANRIVPADLTGPADEAGLKMDLKMASDEKKGVYVGRLATADHIVHTVAEKHAIAERTGALAVDMESLAVAEVCRERKVKFLAVRAISDDCSADLPSEVLSVLGGTGSIRAGAVVGALWNRPSSYKDLWRLRQNANLAADRLGLFLASMLKQMVEPRGW
ncbi:MAG: 5'-methylthioadenosine nucleosidase [Planctomycetaceae bacterium]